MSLVAVGNYAYIDDRLFLLWSEDDRAGSSDEEFSAEDMEAGEGAPPRSEGRELKDELLRKYSGYLSSLKKEFSKKKKKGKLPKEARQTLLDWWNLHYKWPYPTVRKFLQTSLIIFGSYCFVNSIMVIYVYTCFTFV